MPRGTRVALYRGFLLKERGLDILIQAAAYLDPATVIVLTAAGEQHAELEAQIAREGLAGRIRFIPLVPYEELQEWTASADLGLSIFRPDSVSVETQLSNKVFEYIMAGVPVLTSPLPAVVELLAAYNVGRVVEAEPVTIGHAITAMLDDVEGLRRMHDNALAAAQHELCWEIEQQRLVALYAELSSTKRVRQKNIQMNGA